MAVVRVLFIANTYPYWTGTDAGGLVLIRRMAARGYTVTVLQTWSSILEPHLQDVDGVTLVRVPGDSLHFEQMQVGWLRLLREHPSDVCILNKGFYLMRHEWIDLGARLSTRRYVALENHPADAPEEAGHTGKRWLKAQAAFAFHYAALHEVVTISAAVRDRLRRWYRLPRNKGIVIPHGIDTDAHRFDAAGRQRLRAKLGVPDGAFLFGSIGRLAPEKGLDRLLPIFARLRAEPGCGDVRLVLAGQGGWGDRLRADAERLGIADHVIFPGWLDDAERIPFLSALDCFVLPSRDEGQGLALLEAMACERMVIGTACGGVDDILTDPAVGWIVPNEDKLEEFGQAMREVLALPAERRAEVGVRARRHTMANFNVEQQADRQIDALLGSFADR